MTDTLMEDMSCQGTDTVQMAILVARKTNPNWIESVPTRVQIQIARTRVPYNPQASLHSEKMGDSQPRDVLVFMAKLAEQAER